MVGVESITYTNAGMVKAAMQWGGTSVDEFTLWRCMLSATASCHTLLRNTFYPEIDTVYFDYPSDYFFDARTLALTKPILSLTALTAGTESIPVSDVTLMNWNQQCHRAPFRLIRINDTSGYTFHAGESSESAVAVTGKFGYEDTLTALVAATLAAAITSTTDTTVTLRPNSVGPLIPDVGSLLLIDDEYLICMSVNMATSGQSLQTSMTAGVDNRAVAVTDGTKFAIGEVIQIDSECMLITGITGNTLHVKRAIEGTVLAAHTAGSGTVVYARRQFTCIRGALGSTAATHSNAASIYTHAYPPLLVELCLAETLVLVEQVRSNYARTIGSGPYAREATNKGLEDVRARAAQAFGRTLYGAV